MRNLLQRFRSLFGTWTQKVGGALLLIKSSAALWEWAKPMIDAVGRVDLIWQFRGVLGWHWVVPVLAAFVSFFNSGLGTALIILVGFALILLGGRKDNHIGGTVFTPTLILGPPPQFFVSHIEVSFDRLVQDAFLHFKIIVVACANNLTIDKLVNGYITHRLELTAYQQQKPILTKLESPQIEDVRLFGGLTQSAPDSSPVFAVNRGVWVIHLRQHIPPAIATNINLGLATVKQPLKSEFYFRHLTINVASPKYGKERLRLWEGVACTPGMAFRPIYDAAGGLDAPAPLAPTEN